MIFLYIFLAVSGVLNTIQAGSNSTLHKQLHHPILPAIVSFGVGSGALLLALVLYGWITRTPLPTAQQWSSAPWWAWIGGLLGSVYVLGMVNLSGKVGAGVFTGLTVTAGIVTSLVMDHFGLLGFERHSANIPRLVGGALMIAGLFLIGKF